MLAELKALVLEGTPLNRLVFLTFMTPPYEDTLCLRGGLLFSVSCTERLGDEGVYMGDLVAAARVGAGVRSGYCFLLTERGVRSLEKTKSEWELCDARRGLAVSVALGM